MSRNSRFQSIPIGLGLALITLHPLWTALALATPQASGHKHSHAKKFIAQSKLPPPPDQGVLVPKPKITVTDTNGNQGDKPKPGTSQLQQSGTPQLQPLPVPTVPGASTNNSPNSNTKILDATGGIPGRRLTQTTPPPDATQPNRIPPNIPRAISPPVGDIAVSNIGGFSNTVDLGTGQRVPRLVLRDAPVREVLTLLARAAGMNVVFTTELPTGQGQQGQFQPSVPGGRLPGDTSPGQPGASQSSVPGVAINEGPRISLDIENESIQDVFNYVLRVGGLQANRQGRTIFVGIKLPVESQNLVIRTFRLNQASAGAASSILATYGADTRQSFQRETLASVGQDNAAQLVRILEPPEIITVTVNPGQAGNSPLVLKGLAVTIDERMNSVTLVGDPQRVEIATNILTQLDARRRQVIVNVKIIDVDLLSLNQTSSSFSFGINDTFFTFDQGAAVINFGLFRPPTDRDAATSITRRPNVFLPEEDPRTDQGIGTNFFRFPTQFLARLQAQVQTGNAKILTDPTLVVQEGQTARVQLTQDVVTNIAREIQSERERESTESTQILTERRNESGPPFQFAIGEAGLTLSVEVQRVDDNGFVSMNVIPIVSSISGTQVVSLNRDRNTLYLLNRRALNSGLIRLRDGQTLVLSGIIQDSDRATVRKVPILGDIPILGALFRRTEKDHQRKEVIVLLTPQIMDDSDRATWGYGYTPGPEVQKMLRQNQNPNPNQR